MSELILPSVVENINGNDQQTNLVSRALVKRRTVYLTGEINDMLALSIITQIQFLDEKSDAPIKMIINSPGGSVTAGLAIYDAMTSGTRCSISTVATGIAASMGAFLLAGGTKGQRYATPNAEIMIHQPSAGTQGKVSDMEVNLEHFLHMKQRLNRIMAQNTGKTEKKVRQDSERDFWLSAEEAISYGIVDAIAGPELLGN